MYFRTKFIIYVLCNYPRNAHFFGIQTKGDSVKWLQGQKVILHSPIRTFVLHASLLGWTTVMFAGTRDYNWVFFTRKWTAFKFVLRIALIAACEGKLQPDKIAIWLCVWIAFCLDCSCRFCLDATRGISSTLNEQIKQCFAPCFILFFALLLRCVLRCILSCIMRCQRKYGKYEKWQDGVSFCLNCLPNIPLLRTSDCSRYHIWYVCNEAFFSVEFCIL